MDTGGGANIGGNVAAGNGVTGRDENHRNNVNVYLGEDLPTNEFERRQWMIRQISELRYALIGDDRFGVSGMVDSVRNQRIWLIVLTALVAITLLILLWQQVQIHQIQFQMQEILQRLNRL